MNSFLSCFRILLKQYLVTEEYLLADVFALTDRHLWTSPRLSSSNGNDFWKCCRALWCDKAGARPSCCESNLFDVHLPITIEWGHNSVILMSYIWIFVCLCVCVQVESHRRAAAARASGKFKDEIIPVSTKVIGFFFSWCILVVVFYIW